MSIPPARENRDQSARCRAQHLVADTRRAAPKAAEAALPRRPKVVLKEVSKPTAHSAQDLDLASVPPVVDPSNFGSDVFSATPLSATEAALG